MTPEAQRIALAEACGLTEIQQNPWYGYTPNMACRPVPDYLNDLNAMHEAENKLSDADHFQFTMCLDALSFLNDPKKKRIIRQHSEPAAQRAEAFLRTLNLWTD